MSDKEIARRVAARTIRHNHSSGTPHDTTATKQEYQSAYEAMAAGVRAIDFRAMLPEPLRSELDATQILLLAGRTLAELVIDDSPNLKAVELAKRKKHGVKERGVKVRPTKKGRA